MAANAPRLVHCSITGYGETGPKADLPGYDFVLQAESGLMSITGAVDGPPVKHGVAIVDIATGLYATIGVLGALQARHATGKGQKVAVSLLETGLSMLANVASNHLATGADARRFGNGHPNIVPYTTFATSDGALALAVGNDGQFARLAQVAGHPEWVKDNRFTKNAGRVKNRVEIEALVSAAIARKPTSWWIETLRGVGVPCGAVNGVKTALADPQALARDMVMEITHPAAGPLKLVGFPVKLAGTPMTATKPPPLLGEHSRDVLHTELGLTPAEIDRLKAANII
jgi:crotonobetainyl-CoA:carnitine CoA-transferase CaiB-like acyl-CoA transferase